MNTYAHPFWAELRDLEACIGAMGARPLKLVCESVWGEHAEVEWAGPEFRFALRDGKMAEKTLLPNAEDGFQISVGTPASKQDEHRHEHTWDIYAAVTPITVHYRVDDGAWESHTIAAGVLIVPPGVWHRVELTGITFVFQAAVAGQRVFGDKTISV